MNEKIHKYLNDLKLKNEIKEAKKVFDQNLKMYGPTDYRTAYSRGYLYALEGIQEDFQ